MYDHASKELDLHIMGVEIERKFLVDHEKWSLASKPNGSNLRQGYLVDDDKRTIRVRVTDAQGFITIKGTTTGFSRKEFEYPIPVEDGLELLDNFAVSELKKVRYCIEINGKTWEVDEFAGDNAGLIVAEIELEREDEIFALPDWVSVEVSSDARYYNSNLSVNPYKNWKNT